ncbi:SAF domain-containing protein [Kitasatospora sp. NPDC056651]|uniref:SAF domain-containing protein n=1 Tax=Kitasatospora sp. NPDC056651 TaxID=3345892 RepID=UPI003695B006
MENRTFATPGTGTAAGAAASAALPDQQEQGGPGKGGGRAVPHAPGRTMRARRRRPAVLAMAVALIAAGGLGGAVLYNSTGQRVAVLALARDVPWGQVITEDDLVVARIAGDPALHPVSAQDRVKAVGMRAATDLKRGAMLTGADLAQGLTVQPGQIVVGVSAKHSQLPASRVQPGVQLVIVFTPDNGRADSLAATAITVGRVDTDGSQVIDVAVGTADGPRLAQWVASGRIQVLLAPRGPAAGGPSGAAPSPAQGGAPTGAAPAPGAATPGATGSGAATPGAPASGAGTASGAPAATGGA